MKIKIRSYLSQIGLWLAPMITADNQVSETLCRRVMFWALAIWGITWLVFPLVFIPGVFFDVAENIEWGRYWQFGYDKHPFVSMWITRACYELTGLTQTMYLLNVISIMLALRCVWLLAVRYQVAWPGRVAVTLLLLTLGYFGWEAVEFNNDVIAISVWAAAMLTMYDALTTQKIRYWVLTAILCAVAMQTKYYAAVLCATLAGPVLFSAEGRKSLVKPGLYVAAAVFILLVLPNLIWLIQHDFLPFYYVEKSMAGTAVEAVEINPWLQRLEGGIKYFGSVGGVMCPMMIIYGILFFRRQRSCSATEFQRIFLFWCTWAPLILTFCLLLILGGKIKTTWLASCFSLLPLFFMVYRPPVFTKRTMWLLVTALAGVYVLYCGVFIYRKAYAGSYLRPGKSCPYEVYPGRQTAQLITDLWHKEYNRPLEYVIAPRKDGVFAVLYSADQPKAFYMADVMACQWIDRTKVLRAGAVIIWEHRYKSADGSYPDWVAENLGEDFARVRRCPDLELERLTVGMVRNNLPLQPCKIKIGVALLPPLD